MLYLPIIEPEENFMRVLQSTSALLAITLTIVTSTSAFAVTDEQKKAIRANCETDFMAHCKGVKPVGIESFQCLVKNAPELTPACHAAVKDVDPSVE